MKTDRITAGALVAASLIPTVGVLSHGHEVACRPACVSAVQRPHGEDLSEEERADPTRMQNEVAVAGGNVYDVSATDGLELVDAARAD